MKKLEDVTEYITPKEVAKKLNIAPETLRKYAILVDKINKDLNLNIKAYVIDATPEKPSASKL